MSLISSLIVFALVSVCNLYPFTVVSLGFPEGAEVNECVQSVKFNQKLVCIRLFLYDIIRIITLKFIY